MAGEREREHLDALETATEAAQAAAARSHVKLHDDAIRAIHETGETHEAGIAAVERTTAALAAAADQQLPSETINDTWQAHLSDPWGIAAALDAVTAAAREEQERKAEAEEAERVAALEDRHGGRPGRGRPVARQVARRRDPGDPRDRRDARSGHRGRGADDGGPRRRGRPAAPVRDD